MVADLQRETCTVFRAARVKQRQPPALVLSHLIALHPTPTSSTMQTTNQLTTQPD
jgi:hypothetical protein